MKEMSLIVNAEIEKTEAMLASKNVTMFVTQAAREWLASNGYNPSMGARPFERLFEEQIKKPLSVELLFGKLKAGGRARIDVDVITGRLLFAVSEKVADPLPMD
jgi:ATP-dependent Clp protease ATP-binding subunit ClpA